MILNHNGPTNRMKQAESRAESRGGVASGRVGSRWVANDRVCDAVLRFSLSVVPPPPAGGFILARMRRTGGKVLRRRRVGYLADQEGDAGHGFLLQAHIHGIKAGFVEFQLLEVDDEVAGEKMRVVGEDHGNGHFDAL